MPGLYVVATPIGNLGDMTARGVDILRQAALVAAEDTRTARILLAHIDASPRAVSLTEHNVEQRIPTVAEAAQSGIVALVSDAGTPVVSDPGARLVDAMHHAGIPVYTIPGASALTSAISLSGFGGDDVHFLGFLPKKAARRAERLTEAARAASVLVVFESPGRLADTLTAIAQTLGDPEVAVCRELTKVYEETVRGTASTLAERFATARGECVIVIRVPPPADAPEEEARAWLQRFRRAGARRSQAAAEVAQQFGLVRSDVYTWWDEAD